MTETYKGLEKFLADGDHDALLEFVIEATSKGITEGFIRKKQLQCKCQVPVPGVFTINYFTTCQRCCCTLSMKDLVERTGNVRATGSAALDNG